MSAIRLVLYLSLLCITCHGLAAVDTASTQIEKTDVTTLKVRENTPEYWKLTELEWQRYKAIMQGPQGRWTPNEDPTFVLGLHAKTTADRRRYAELQVMVEMDRASKALAFDQAYTDAFQRLFPNTDVINLDKRTAQRLGQSSFGDNSPNLPFLSNQSSFRPADRMVLFVEKDCNQCLAHYKQALSVLKTVSNTNLDLFFIGFSNTEIQQWAETQAVPLDMFNAKRILLNPSNDSVINLLSQLKQQHADQNARFFRRRGSEYAKLSH